MQAKEIKILRQRGTERTIPTDIDKGKQQQEK